MTQDKRPHGVVIDLERLEAHAQRLYLHRFVSAVRETRGEHGRWLVLRAGDELAIRAADDGSEVTLRSVVVERPST